MNVFREMFDNDKFESLREFTELQRMLRQAIERGYVEEVPVTLKREVSQVEHWYRDKETGDIYSLIPPNRLLEDAGDRLILTNTKSHRTRFNKRPKGGDDKGGDKTG